MAKRIQHQGRVTRVHPSVTNLRLARTADLRLEDAATSAVAKARARQASERRLAAFTIPTSLTSSSFGLDAGQVARGLGRLMRPEGTP